MSALKTAKTDTPRRSRRQFYDASTGSAAVRLAPLTVAGTFEPARTNCFSIYWIESGAGEVSADTASHQIDSPSLLFFVPYHYLRLCATSPLRGTVIQFHANFLCIETFHAETGCAGMLFNDPYHSPAVDLRKTSAREVLGIIKRMQVEHDSQPPAYEDMLLAQLKVLLILAARQKANSAGCTSAGQPRHPILAPLKQLIEQHYSRHHAPSDYARFLHMPAKTLGRVVREQLGTSLTDLIRQRILTHAKWQLLHTLKPVKQVAREVGFTDELYFSRLFKKATGCSPTFFREFETEIRGGSNLSMLSHPPSISSGATVADD